MVDHAARLERDAFDPFFDHLILYDDALIHRGSHRCWGLSPIAPKGAAKIGRYYSEDEYDLTPLRQSGRRLLEWGDPVCDADYRGGTAMYVFGRPWRIM